MKSTIPPSIRNIMSDPKKSALDKAAEIEAEAKRLGKKVRYNHDVFSPDYGKLVELEDDGTAKGNKRYG